MVNYPYFHGLRVIRHEFPCLGVELPFSVVVVYGVFIQLVRIELVLLIERDVFRHLLHHLPCLIDHVHAVLLQRSLEREDVAHAHFLAVFIPDIE